MKLFLILALIMFTCSCSLYHGRSKIDRVSDRILNQFAKKMNKEEGLYTVGFGGGQEDGKISLIEISFKIDQVLTLEEGRKLIVNSINELLDIINNNPKNEQFFKEFPASSEIVWISIFGSPPKNLNSNQIEVVSFRGSSIAYRKEGPNGRYAPYVEVHEETFEEAERALSEHGFG